MTIDIAILFGVLAGMAFFFFTERLPVDLTAFIGLAVLTLAGYLKPSEAFTGFASPAVITMISIFFVSAAMLHTGLADMVGVRVHRWVGSREVPLIISIMLVSGVLSAFMPNIAACAVLLPAVSSIAKKSGVSPARLFMPLSFGATLGGTTTLVGTPPNILAADMLSQRNLPPFEFFDFTAIGLALMGLGVLYMVTIGRRLLPQRVAASEVDQQDDLSRLYDLPHSLFSIRVPSGSGLDGRTLREMALGATLGVQVAGVERAGKKTLVPDADTRLQAGDVLMVSGPYAQVQKLFSVQGVEIAAAKTEDLPRAAQRIEGIEFEVTPKAPEIGKNLREIGFRGRYEAEVVAIRREGVMLPDFSRQALQAGDRIFALGRPDDLEALAGVPFFKVLEQERSIFEELGGHLFLLRIPSNSKLQGTTLGQSRMRELVGLTVAGIVRKGQTLLAASPEEMLQVDDELLVTGKADRIQALIDLGRVDIQRNVTEAGIQSDDVGIEEAILAPRSSAAGRTLAELNFRERFGLQVLGIWREGRALHEGLADIPLRFGDALLLQGPWSKLRLMGSDRNFVVLSPSVQEARRTSKAPLAVGALVLMIVFVTSGYQPIHVAAFIAAIMVVLTRCITMEEAYRAVDWRTIFLVAAILPMGIAMENTGAADLIANTLTLTAGPLGAYAVLTGVNSLSSALSQALDGAPAVVLLTPVVMEAAQRLSLDPRPLMMGVALAASVAFMTPFSGKANLLVMGAGGYRVVDYLKVGTPLTVLIIILLTLMVPIFFPF